MVAPITTIFGFGSAVVIIELRLTKLDMNASLNCSIGEQSDAQR
jgi:hypothetical protein